MRFERHWRRVLVAPVLEQRADVALVVDLDGLLRRRRMVAGRAGLQHQSIDGSKDKELSDQAWHGGIRSARVKAALARPEDAI